MTGEQAQAVEAVREAVRQPNRAARRNFRGEHRVKAQSRRDMFAASFDDWAERHGARAIARALAAAEAAQGGEGEA